VTQYQHDQQLVPFAKRLRKEMTKEENSMGSARRSMLLAGNPSVSLTADSSLYTREPF
jgi:hypothetical protein